ncbi:serpin (serine proteinase inhibitor) superfamily protein [Toxoplasma gondii TgCatPRC2]|uniref:Serine protease inhibitor, putative n=6 Tax=Toxoplasma gondii TaxID=5811 RepID=B6KGP8_TOXGV|nr:serpin (serine proteinase inhibitor) superfamily protein [Toxoplasma gondii ME49]ESS34226.1 serpin (serine proteinase inhibitor) superfamily protein [Toxoplasma gondii VEG]KFG46969.1 serpin (serine proteinase inhibitor) superfamily protein [Toxoplasma gondii GAB2-2007-GAL-DOM2]KYF49220.1 serpin (serine proteinase inhibitor) superfamily protein [Toxoplasma gondii ARI]KYK68388.1 serpin (serine proteinase inhibitor) superfamily protein [Toxoplasma gondii TgCatPRC2]PIM04783.1 serpin (serine pro|eukprot:XP_002367021.1 serpin (serine proteinase inhibitor) superfamily protein [Toxoplasma gondii ME49]
MSNFLEGLASFFSGKKPEKSDEMASMSTPAAELQRAMAARKRAQGRDGNFVMSPFSVLLVFAMAMRGASGPTLREMHNFLKLSSLPAVPKLDQEGFSPEAAPQLAVGSRVYVHQDFEGNPQFRKYASVLKTESAGETEAKTLDFADTAAAVEEINGFVSKQTHEHIKQLVTAQDVNPNTKLVLVSAMYFKCSWAKQFPKHRTDTGTFHALVNGKHVEQQVSMMHTTLKDSPLAVKVDENVVAIALPYSDPNTAMYIIQPRDSHHLATLFDKKKSAELGVAYIESLVREMRSEETAEAMWGKQVRLTMPKFKLSSAANREDLIPVFSEVLGIKSMFDVNSADFSKITGNRDLVVSSFLHAADIDVDENGTVATAATAMGMMLRMAMAEPKIVNVTIDRPFAFQIRYTPASGKQDGSDDYVLFSGQITDVAAAQ